MSNFRQQSPLMPVKQYNYRISGFFKKAWVERLCCFIFVFFSAVVTLAQQLNDTLNLKEIDSIKKILPALNDTSRIEYEAEISRQYFFKHIDDSSFHYADIVYNKSARLKYYPGLARACLYRASIANYNHDYLKSEEEAQEALYWYNQSQNKKDIFKAYGLLGWSQMYQVKYDDAVINLNLGYEWANKFDNEVWMNRCLESMTDVYRDRGDYVKLLETQQKLILIDRASGDTNYYSGHELWMLGLMYKLLGEYRTALPFWRQLWVGQRDEFGWSCNLMEYAELLTLANKPDSALYYYNQFDSVRADAKDLRFFLISKGEYYLFLKQYKTALPYFQKGLIYHRQLEDNIQVKRALLDIGKTYAVLRKNDSAIIYTRQGLNMALKAQAKPSIRDAYEILYSVYDHLHKPDSAYYYYHSYIIIKEAVMNNQTMGKMAAYDYEHKIALLDKEKIVQQQQLQQELFQKKVLVGSVIALLLIGTIVFRIIILKRKNEKLRLENELHIQQLETEKTRAELQRQAAELEMQALRAQMNPHFIFNSLNSINMFILENNKLQASEYLAKFSRLIRLILQNSKEAFISLESELEALQLYIELESLRFDNKFEYKISVDEDIDTTILKVPPLIIQPYAENAIWHGLMHKKEKGHLEIKLYQQDEILFCKITDDGIGRKKAAELKSKSSTHKSMGIKITKSRIEMMQSNGNNKSVEIKDLVYADGSEAGTEVVLRIPVVNS
jgi:hypothetical protein